MAQPTRGRNSQAKNHLITIVLALIIAVLATWFGYGRDHAAADPSATAAPGVTATAMPGDGLTVTYLDVGQGDCTLLQCDGQVMLIDAAEGNQANKITAYLKQHGVTAIDSPRHLPLHRGGQDCAHLRRRALCSGCIPATLCCEPACPPFPALGMPALGGERKNVCVSEYADIFSYPR